MSGTAQPERGAALLVVMVSVAVLTAVAANLAYESRVSLRIAANARDELRASYLARSGVTLSRLVLSFQQEVNDVPRPAGVPIPRFQLWRLLPAGSDLARTLFPAAGPAPGAAGPERGFEAEIDDESRKVNAQLEGLASGTAGPKLATQVAAVYQVICDPRWDRLFEREDALGVRSSREDLLVRLRDWVDDLDVASALNADFREGSCGAVIMPPAFADSFGDENQPYDRGDDRYKVKNARMDSLDELFLVAGVGDAFMAAFADAFTVYLPRDAKRTVNELDRQKLVWLAMLVADPPGQQRLFDPEFAERLQALVLERTVGGLLAITPAQLGEAVLAAGVTINANLLQDSNVNNPFTDTSNTFRVRATGRAGAVTAAIDAVVRMEKVQAGTPVAAPGWIVHWREE